MRSTTLSSLGFLAGALFLAPALAAAQVPPLGIPAASMGPLCTATGLCGLSAPVGVQLLQVFLLNLVNTIRVVFVGVCTFYFAWFAVTMIAKGYEENTLSEQKKAFGYSAMGLGIVGVSSFLVQTFAPGTTGGFLVNPAPFDAAANLIADYLIAVTGGFLIFVLSMAGFRMIVLQGNEGEIQKQKKNFFSGLIGIGILLLARVIVFAFVGGAGPSPMISEIAGVIRFLLEIVAGLAVIALVAAGFFYITSLSGDERKQRAKRMVTSTVIVLVIVIAAHTIIATFIR
jgi:uncharacterized membrane protein YhdT